MAHNFLFVYFIAIGFYFTAIAARSLRTIFGAEIPRTNLITFLRFPFRAESTFAARSDGQPQTSARTACRTNSKSVFRDYRKRIPLSPRAYFGLFFPATAGTIGRTRDGPNG
jgi:hypothetical protein